MSTPVNVRVTADGARGRPVCEFCGRSTRALFPLLDGRLSALWWLPGWSVAPYPADFVHQDGSSGSTWTMTAAETDLVDWMAAHSWAPETRKSVRESLSCFYRWARVHQLRPDDPTVDLPPIRVPPPCPHPVGDSALRRARIRATSDQRLMLDLAALGGLRRAEVAGVAQEDLVGDLLRVVGKGGRVRVIPLPAELVARIHAGPGGFLFPGRFGGHTHPDRVGRTLSTLLGPGLTAHSLRHRFATRAYEGTHDILALQELLGHSSPETTRRYVRVSMEALRATAAAAG